VTKRPVAIRGARAEDVPALVALGERCFPDPWNAVSFAEELRGTAARIWLAHSDATLAGYLVARFVAGECHILALAVAPECRRGGIAKELVAVALTDRSRGPVAVAHLEVRRGNRGAQAFYRSCGFEPVGVRSRYYPNGEDAVLLTRNGLLGGAASVPAPSDSGAPSDRATRPGPSGPA
jgi:ribosomal-protein-alanine N-acetyltransferase